MNQKVVSVKTHIVSDGLCGYVPSIKKTADLIGETRTTTVYTTTNGLLAKHTGKSAEDIDVACSFDNVINAQEAIELGLCDAIVSLF